VDISPATELSDYLDSHFHGNDKEDRGNDRGETDIGVEDINDLCPQCREELGVMDLLGFGLYGSAGGVRSCVLPFRGCLKLFSYQKRQNARPDPLIITATAFYEQSLKIYLIQSF